MTSMFLGTTGLGSGLRFYLDARWTRTEEDWSQVRSPSRARRRLKLGHQQRIRHLLVPRTDFVIVENRVVVCHPAMFNELKKALSSVPDAKPYSWRSPKANAV